MGIYIKGMEMPKSCGYCPLKYLTMEGDECMLGVADMTYQGRPKDCPLVPVPPHGDLIDRDALTFSRIRIAHPDGIIGGYNAVVMSCAIKDAPTIIPAEEGE